MARRLPPPLERTAVPDGELAYDPEFLSAEIADRLLARLTTEIAWDQHVLQWFGRGRPSPRLSAWYGNATARYSYSGLTLEPRPWLAPLATLRRKVQAAAGARFNAVLANLYRDGNDSMGWHADDEPELGTSPVIASVSLGAPRRFRLRHVGPPDLALAFDLTHGSLLVMAGELQHHWRHTVPKTTRSIGPRLNLTFRRILPPRELARDSGR
jgi:alkylated DNA repair dioxygenase AlkB